MLDAIVSGEESPERLADLALGKLRSKISELQLPLEGCIRDHHRFLLDTVFSVAVMFYRSFASQTDSTAANN